ncbi:AAA family ATPase [candidate division GN15 bacterium]|nr:AAA family ATPase [candidate division GN15 bacterium]
MNMQSTPPRIVITGAPGSAKSLFLDRLRDEPFMAGFVFFEEVARVLLESHPELRGQWAEFHRRIYARQTAQEAAVGTRPFVTDRGTVDAHAFHPETLADVGTSLEREYERYTAVIHLQTAAALDNRPWETDSVRTESRDDALAIERALKLAWQDHPGYYFLPAENDVDRKYRRFRDMVRQEVEDSGG